MSRALARGPGNFLRLSSSIRRAFSLSTCRLSDPPSSNSGYIILLPELPPDTGPSNSLLNESIPDFETLTASQCFNAMGRRTLELESEIWKVEGKLKDPNFPKTYENVLESLEGHSSRFDYVWSILKLLSIANNKYFPESGYRKIHDRARLARSKKFTNLPIYLACKELRADSDKLNEPQKRVVDKFLIEGGLSGVELTGGASTQLKQTLVKLNEAKVKFRENVELATTRFRHLIVEPKYVGEMPGHLLKHLAKDKSQPSKGPWFVTLHNPSYRCFLEYCPEPGIRWNAWNAFNTKASGHYDKNLDNSHHIEELRNQRLEQAKILGFENYVELSMQTKMAENEENVQSLLATLFTRAKPKQLEEFESLKDFAASRGFEGVLRPWDVPYWRRKHRSALFSVDEESIREYFPFPEVWKNLCKFCEDMFGISFKPTQTSVWDEEVLYFEIHDSSTRKCLGGFFLDPYSRDSKLGNATATINHKTLCSAKEVTPLISVILNFSPPMYGKPSLLSFDDVNSLFFKMGAVLQHVLSAVPYHEVSGSNFIEWDSVFVPQKFMTMWLGNKTIVKEISAHYETGEKLPDDKVRNLLRSRKHMSAFDLCHEVYISALDLELYSTTDFWVDIMKKLWPVYHEPLQLDKRDSHVCSILDIFSGDFAAAYYCNLWSQMLAADVYLEFVEKGQKRNEWTKLGRRFRESFLEMGGGYSPNKVFRHFRGRDPCPDAMLWALGISPMKESNGNGILRSTPTDEEQDSQKAAVKSSS